MSLFLGLDSSTQGLKAEIIDIDAGTIIDSASVNFGKDLPEYNCPNGYLEHSNPLIKHADPLMWAAALDLVLIRLQKKNAPLNKIIGISGSGQQHGSVYLNNKFTEIISELDPEDDLANQLALALSRNTSPIWMDRATEEECRELQDQFGERLQQDTGSPAIERFTGPQIRKFMKDDSAAYSKTEYIHLVSSFMASILTGRNSPIDFGDGAGMNLLNMKTLQWDDEITKFTAPNLIDKLPLVVNSDTIAGELSEYYCKYGLKAGIPVAVWSGDNPCSLIGTGAAEPGVAVISLGTSDTFFAAMRDFKTDPHGYGHVFGNPAGGFMSLICFSNGSLAREEVKKDCNVSWEYFDSLPENKTFPGNEGNLMLPYFSTESTPVVLNPEVKYNFCTDKADSETKIRCILESQALSMRLHSSWMGETFTRIRITGGASNCVPFLQILADVFQAQIERISITDSAGLGAALRVANAVAKLPFHELFEQFTAASEIIMPNPDNARIYNKALKKYAELENK
jgi:xylulokinase